MIFEGPAALGLSEANMCLTIPQKIVEILSSGEVMVEDHAGNRRKLKTLIELAVGDFVISQQNIVLEKMEREYAEEIFKLINTKGGDHV